MKIRKLALAALMAMGLNASAAYYMVGAFNSWNALAPVSLTDNGEGMWSATVDFTSGSEFKLSTTCGTEGNGWSQFDAGTLVYTPNPAVADTWLPLTQHPVSGNLSAPSTGLYTVTVNSTEGTIRFATVHSGATYSGTLPVMFINTEGGVAITSKETYVTATYYLDPMGVEGVQAIGSADAPLTTQIRGRGNYTWVGFEKKPYRLKLADKQPLLGMPKSKHWALMAQADDPTGFMRNMAGFAASEMLGMPWTPQQQPVEVVLNGDYRGLYFLTQTVRVDKDRVNIVEQTDLATTDVDGGWLVEIDNYDTDPHVTVYEGDGSGPIWFTYKSPEVLSTQQEQYLQTAMQDIDNALYSDDAQAFERLVDLDVLARYYITQELFDDVESFHGSCYLNRNRGAAEKWKFGPVWDFGNGLIRGESEKFIWQDPTFHQVWIGEMYAFSIFRTAIDKVWKDFLDGNGPRNLDNAMSAFASRIAAAAAADRRRWPDYGTDNEQAASANFRYLFNKRVAWLEKQWGKSGVDDITADTHTGITVAAAPGAIVITARDDATLVLSTVTGAARTVTVKPGVNTVHTAPGLYIVAGRKVLVK